MFYFWYLQLCRYYSKLIKRTQSFLKPVAKLVVFLQAKTTDKVEWQSIKEELYRKSRTNSNIIALVLFLGLASSLSLLLNGVSKISFSNLFADANIIVEAMDLQDPVSTNETVSINDINLDSYDYYQNLNMEAKPENFLDLYLVEDEAFLLRTVDFSNSEIDVSKPDRIITYVVKQGDTLEKIAKNFGINVETLKTANSLKKSVIAPGQKLVILPISGIYYTVKKGDSLGKLAIKYKISASVIREYNNLEDDTLKINEKIILPGAKEQIIVNNSISSATKITDTGNSGFFMYPTVGWN
jgi:LysM repeat protein